MEPETRMTDKICYSSHHSGTDKWQGGICINFLLHWTTRVACSFWDQNCQIWWLVLWGDRNVIKIAVHAAHMVHGLFTTGELAQVSLSIDYTIFILVRRAEAQAKPKAKWPRPKVTSMRRTWPVPGACPFGICCIAIGMPLAHWHWLGYTHSSVLRLSCLRFSALPSQGKGVYHCMAWHYWHAIGLWRLDWWLKRAALLCSSTVKPVD